MVLFGHFTRISPSFVPKAKYFYLFCVCKSTSSFQSFNVLVQAYLTDSRKELKIFKSPNQRRLTLPSELMSAFSKAFSRFSAPDFFFFLAAANAPTLPGIFCKGVLRKAPYIKAVKKMQYLYSPNLPSPQNTGQCWYKTISFISICIFLREIQFAWPFFGWISNFSHQRKKFDDQHGNCSEHSKLDFDMNFFRQHMLTLSSMSLGGLH